MVNVEVSDFVREKLNKIKERDGHKALDSVIRDLLLKEELSPTIVPEGFIKSIRLERAGYKKIRGIIDHVDCIEQCDDAIDEIDKILKEKGF